MRPWLHVEKVSECINMKAGRKTVQNSEEISSLDPNGEDDIICEEVGVGDENNVKRGLIPGAQLLSSSLGPGSKNSRTLISMLFGIIACTFFVICLFAFGPNRKTCPKTKIFPFDTGCPYDCAKLRPNLHNSTFYKLAAHWEFGELSHFRGHAASVPPTAFHGASKLAKSFISSESRIHMDVLMNVARNASPFHRLRAEKQKVLHVSLSYLCCLVEKEIPIAMNVISKWNSTTTFSLPVTFTNLQCLQETRNSVTVIFKVDEKSEQALMHLNRDLKAKLEQAGVKVWVDREQQMPFHTTVIGFHLDKSKDISSYLRYIWKGVHDANHVQATATINFGLRAGPQYLSRGSKRA